jgi:PhnB protein
MAESGMRPIPEGFHSLTPSLTVHDASGAIEFYKQAFGATEVRRATAPDGQKLWHAELQIGDSRLMLSDEFPEMGGWGSARTQGGTPTTIWLYVEDVDAVFKSAVDAGATSLMGVDTQFWGDRFGSVEDPFGHRWSIATHVEDVSEEEQRRRAAAFTGG